MSKDIYQLKINLLDAKPPIWRRVQVSNDTLLPDLHRIIQVAMGWYNAHLHQFIVGNWTVIYGPPNPDLEDLGIIDYRNVKIGELMHKSKDRIKYEYDFGDGWLHEILLEKVLEKEKGQQYPVCIKGKRACPPEDCGGIPGYEEFREIMADPEHEEHQEMKEWYEEDWDPEYFDHEEVNAMLQSGDYKDLI